MLNKSQELQYPETTSQTVIHQRNVGTSVPPCIVF